MQFKLELPEGTIIMNRTDLKKVLQELLLEVQAENTHEEIITIREAADYLKVSVPTVRNMIANQEIPFFQRGHVIRLNRREVKEWLSKNTKNNNDR